MRILTCGHSALVCITLTALLLAGCGSSSGELVGQPGVTSVNPQNSGTIAFQFQLARAVPERVDSIDFHGFTEDGRLVYGPAPRAKAPEILLEAVPLVTRTFRLDYYDGDLLIAQGLVSVLPSPNGRVTVTDPDFVDVTPEP